MNPKHIAVIVSFYLLSISNAAVAQKNWLWDNGGSANDEALANAVDVNGNVYTTGYYSRSAKFGDTVLTALGFGDVFVSKQDSTGKYLWTVSGGGVSSDRAYSISADAFGNVFVTGFYTGIAIFGSDTLLSIGSSVDIFVSKIDASGSFLWTKSFGGRDVDIGLGVHADILGNVIVTGQFKDSAQFGNVSFLSEPDTTGSPSYDIFLMKLDSSGNVSWVKQGSSRYDDRGLAVSSDLSGNIYMTGQYSDTLTLDSVFAGLGYSISFIAKFDTAGNILWLHQLLGTQVLAYSVQCYKNDVYIGGDFGGQLAIIGNPTTYLNKPYNYKIFVARLDSSGKVKWATCDGSNNQLSALAMTVDDAGSAYLAGTFNCVMTEYASLYGTGIFNSIGFRDIFISKYSNNGLRQYERQYGGSRDDYCPAISIFQQDHPVIAGSFENRFSVPNGGNFLSNNTNRFSSANQPGNYCNDHHYNAYIGVAAVGNKDIFSASPFDISRDPYDYFDRTGDSCLRDTLLPYINQNRDTVAGCDTVMLYASTRTGISIGPEYEYQWSNGQNQDTISADTTGMYYLTMTNKDNCRHYSDSVYVEVYKTPPLPVIATTVGTIRKAISNGHSCGPEYNTLIIVLPDTATVYCTNAPPGYIVQWQTPVGLITSDSIKPVVSGAYYLTVSSPAGSCQNSNCVDIDVFTPSSGGGGGGLPTNLNLQIHLTDSVFDKTDTVRLCEGDVFAMILTDSASWAMKDTLIIPTYCDWSIGHGDISFTSLPLTFNYHVEYFKAGATGPCTVSVIIEDPINGGTAYTVTRNFYLIAYPEPIPNAQWHGPSFLCPGDTATLTLTGASLYKTTGPGIIYLSPNQDTVITTSAGRFFCSTTTIDSIHGCNAFYGINFDLASPTSPHIAMIPPSGIICPNDSVEMIAEKGSNYTWFGPFGNQVGQGQTIFAKTPGDYHYNFTDSLGCNLVSEFIEIKTYSSPYLAATPGPLLCQGGSIEISVQTNDSTLLHWLSPLSGSSVTQTITSPGTYACSVSSCGITTTADITITLDVPPVHISLSGDSVICAGDTLVLSGNSGMATYSWQPNNLESQSIFVSTAGLYKLTVTDLYGCSASDSVRIDTLHSASLPIVSNATICAGDSVRLTASGDGRIDWYALFHGASIDSDSVFITPPLFSNTTYYVTNYNFICHSPKVPVVVTINPASLLPAIISDGSCSYDSLHLSSGLIAGALYHWSGPKGFSAAQASNVIYPIDITYSGYYLLYVSDNMCTSPTDSIPIHIYNPTPSHIIASDTLFCSGTSDTLRANRTFASYIWLPGGSTDSIFIANASGSYSLVTTDIHGCLDTSASANLTVVINPVIPQANDTNICAGTQVALTDNYAYNVHWYDHTHLQVSTSHIFITPAINDTAVYYIQHLDTIGCKSPLDSITIYAEPKPPLPQITGDTLYCEGTTISLSASIIPGEIYNWEGPDGFALAGANFNIPNSVSNETGIYLLIVSMNNCSDTVSSNIVVDLVPTNNIFTNAPVCAGSTLTFSTDSIYHAIYSWRGPSGFTSSTYTNNISNAKLANSGYYSLEVTKGICSSGIDSTYLKIASYPSFNLGKDTVICAGTSYTLRVDTGYDLYDWSTGANTNEITVKDSGNYSVRVTNYPDCSFSDTIKINTVDCKPSIPNVFTPNGDGRNDKFYVVFKGAKGLTITIFDRWGKQIKQLSGISASWDGKTEGGEDVAQGTYYYVIKAVNYFDQQEEYKGALEVLR